MITKLVCINCRYVMYNMYKHFCVEWIFIGDNLDFFREVFRASCGPVFSK